MKHLRKKFRKKFSEGFTLIELLLVIGVISILSAIVIVAVNPSRQFTQTQHAERHHIAKQLQDAISQYLIDNGDLPGNKAIPEGEDLALNICRESVTNAVCVTLDDITTTYIPEIPVDPSELSQIVTGYKAYLLSGRPRVFSVHLEGVAGPTDYNARWSISESGGATTFTDTSGNGLDGTCTGGGCPDVVAGITGNALDFDGTDDVVTIADSDLIDFDTDDDFTIAVWVKLPVNQSDTGMNQNSILEKKADAYPYVLNVANQTHATNGRIIAARYDGSSVPAVTSATSCNDNEWHHAAFVKDGETLKLYIDGAEEDSATDTTSSSTTNSAVLWIGKRQAFSTYFEGLIDDVRIYGRALSDSEIAAIAAG